MKRFLITGGNFINMGAAAMSYVTISELRKKYPDCEITMAIDYGDGNTFDNLKCDIIYLNSDCMKMLSGNLSAKRFMKAIIKKCVGKEDAFKQVRDFRNAIKKCDAAFDISGYILSSQWDINGNLEKLGQMNAILENEIPYYIMPQSFGPFEYGVCTEMIISKLRDVLSRCKLVYAREMNGYQLLKEQVGLTNVLYSPDIVLQSKGIAWDSIFKYVPQTNIKTIIPKNSVAIVPNKRVIEQKNEREVIDLYYAIIKELLLLNKEIFLISHSAEDKAICRALKKIFPQQEVHFFDEYLDTRSFESIIQNMDFVIASRFHSIVHSYKNGIPCIILGWAVKYKELAKLFGQEKYVFDIKNVEDAALIIDAERDLNVRLEAEKEIIGQGLKMVQKSNCFNELEF